MSAVLDDIDQGYLQPSAYARGDGGDAMVLQTAAGLTPAGLVAHPLFFAGTLARPDVVASGLRALVEIASTRYFNPIPGGFKSLDPVLTANGDRLRAEAFSACNGVYARLDVLEDCLRDGALGFGTTNIDINAPLALALAGIRQQDRLHLTVGPGEVQMAMPSGSYAERKVALPERWVRGLAETQSLAATLELRATLDAAGCRRFLHGLSTSGGSGAGVSTWLLPGPRALRATSTPQPGAIPMPGTARLGAVRRVLHLVQSAQVFAPPVDAQTVAAVSAWQFQLPGARLLLMLSPQPYRGFSGEGAVLHALGQAQEADATTLSALLAWEPVIDPAALAQEMGLARERVHHALQVLATSGHVGFDLHENAYFHRQLPFVDARLERNYPRLVAARALLDAGAVRPGAGDFLEVQSEENVYYVKPEAGRLRCTCHFWTKYKGSRGPCKHVLAAQLWQERGR